MNFSTVERNWKNISSWNEGPTLSSTSFTTSSNHLSCLSLIPVLNLHLQHSFWEILDEEKFSNVNRVGLNSWARFLGKISVSPRSVLKLQNYYLATTAKDMRLKKQKMDRQRGQRQETVSGTFVHSQIRRVFLCGSWPQRVHCACPAEWPRLSLL